LGRGKDQLTKRGIGNRAKWWKNQGGNQNHNGDHNKNTEKNPISPGGVHEILVFPQLIIKGLVLL
jgi:hypothetical protein